MDTNTEKPMVIWVTRNLNEHHDEHMTYGDRLADSVARWGGSWKFIICAGIFLSVWTITNSFMLKDHGFDPYPFVFLNLLLSMIAALQAPVIMMSQNRQSAKDRLGVELDYEVNRKAEEEICRLHEKMDREILALHHKIDILLKSENITETLPTERSN